MKLCYCGEHNYDVFATSMILQPLETTRQPAQQQSVLSKLMLHEHNYYLFVRNTNLEV